MNFILWTTRTWHVLSLQVLFLFIFIAGVEAQSALPDAIAPIWQQAAARPADFGLACMPLDRQGQTVLYNADAFPLASVSKLLIFIEYARRVDAGLIPLDEVVSVAALEAYNVPRTDRGAHDRFMAQYPAGTTTLPLWDVATEGMMQYSANTASDYVLHRLAPVDWTGLYALLGVYEASVPRSLSMIPLLMNSHQNGRAAAGSVEALSAEQGETLLDLYVHDRLWRDAEIVYRAEGGARRLARVGCAGGDFAAAHVNGQRQRFSQYPVCHLRARQPAQRECALHGANGHALAQQRFHQCQLCRIWVETGLLFGRRPDAGGVWTAHRRRTRDRGRVPPQFAA